MDLPKNTAELEEVAYGSPQFPEFSSAMAPAPTQLMDDAVARLIDRKRDWASLDIETRIHLLEQVRRDLVHFAGRLVAANMQANGVPVDSQAEGHEWGQIAFVARQMRLLRRSLDDIRRFGRPRIPGPVTTRPDGQVVAQVFPLTRVESLLYAGISGEVWMEPGVTAEGLPETQATAYRRGDGGGSVCLILGGGNGIVPPVLDTLYKLFVEKQVVLLKPNPVNAYISPLLEGVFQALIDRGFMRIVNGGVAQSAYLCQHEGIDTLHMTGSDKTYEAIRFGSGEEGARRKAARRPINVKPFTAELGNVSPVIVVPGPWRDEDIREQALALSSWLAINAGFVCVAPRVILQHQEWSQRDILVEAIRQVLAGTETKRAFYPGAKQRQERFVDAHPEALQLGRPQEDDHLPWTFVPRIDPRQVDDICFQSEAFCALFAETALPAPDIPTFIERAVDFANRRIWGTLAATLIVHPASMDDPRIAAAVENAVAELRYGVVGLNDTPLYGGFIGSTTWGGYTGHDMYNIQSGSGVVCNALMFSRPQKSVFRARFHNPFDINSLSFKHGREFWMRLTQYEAAPAAWKLPGMIWYALRG